MLSPGLLNRLIVIGVLLITSPLLATEYDWFVTNTGGPPERLGHDMVYDSSRGVTVMFGGTGPNGILSDTWEYDGDTWTRIDIPGPGNRYFHEMAFDSLRGVVVMFGGFTRPGQWSSISDQTWEYDGTQWNLVATSGPEARYTQGMAFDSNRGVTVMFGGYNRSYNNLRDTWEWDGVSWTHRSSSGPSARRSTEMAFNPSSGKTVLFGGNLGGWPYRFTGDTWEWDGSTWVLAATSGPHPRGNHEMSFHSGWNAIVLFGGVFYNGETGQWEHFPELWTWDGSAWSLVESQGPPVELHPGLDYHSESDRLVVFGGNGLVSPYYSSNTWAYARSCLYGPETQPLSVVRQKGAPRAELFTWESCGGIGTMIIESINVGSAELFLNDVQLVDENDLNRRVTTIAVPVELIEGANNLRVLLRSQPGSQLLIELVEE